MGFNREGRASEVRPSVGYLGGDLKIGSAELLNAQFVPGIRVFDASERVRAELDACAAEGDVVREFDFEVETTERTQVRFAHADFVAEGIVGKPVDSAAGARQR